MKITLKTETEILKEVELNEITDEIQKELETSFNDKPILKYKFLFFFELLKNRGCYFYFLDPLKNSEVGTLLPTIPRRMKHPPAFQISLLKNI